MIIMYQGCNYFFWDMFHFDLFIPFAIFSPILSANSINYNFYGMYKKLEKNTTVPIFYYCDSNYIFIILIN